MISIWEILDEAPIDPEKISHGPVSEKYRLYVVSELGKISYKEKNPEFVIEKY